MISKWKILVISVVFLAGAVVAFSPRKPVIFTVESISSDLEPRPEWNIAPIPMEEIKTILSQKFRYLARGAQSFAFVSEDEKYVIKFFRMKHLLSKFKDNFRPGVVKRRQESLNSIFGAHILAWNELRQETGLVFVHLNKSNDLNLRLQVRDWLGRAHEIDLDQTEFVLQERAELIFTHLKKLADQGNQEQFEKAIGSFMQLIKLQERKRIFDRDKAISHNYGFVGDRPIHLDIGRLTQGDKPGECERIWERIQVWLNENKLR